MNWTQASNLILNNIIQGQLLDPRLPSRIVTEVPPYACYRNHFQGVRGFKIQVGVNSFLEVPLEMLEEIHFESTQYWGGCYDRLVFHQCFPNLFNTKTCYIHTIGMIFANARVGDRISNTQYFLF